MKTDKICVIICEYNPLHNGHKILIDNARKLSGCNFVACIMSGNFSQRGNPCILNKYQRAHLALQAGADIVLHLPTAYSCSSAEVFSRGSINIANSLKNATHIIFGSECGDIDKLNEIANFLIKEPDEYKVLLKRNLSDGNSYPASRLNAITTLADSGKVPSDFVQILSKPNNILGIEYIKAMKQTKSKLIPLTIQRQGQDYNSKKLDNIPSATALRELLTTKKGIKEVKKYIPESCYNTFANYYEKQSLNEKLFEELKLFALKTFSTDYLKEIFDVTEGLENRLHSIARENTSYKAFTNNCQTKRFSAAKLNRICLATLLNITKDVTNKVYSNTLPFIKVLAVKRNRIMGILDSTTPLVIRNNDIPKLNSYASSLIEIEDRADGLYGQITQTPTTLPYLYQTTLIINS